MRSEESRESREKRWTEGTGQYGIRWRTDLWVPEIEPQASPGPVRMADGSVRFIKSMTANQIMWAIGSRAQNEVVDANSY